MTAAERARAVVLRHALDAEEAAELLDMLGLTKGQQDNSTPRSCSGQTARRRGKVHALSAGTAARLATTTAARPTTTTTPVVPPAAPATPPVRAASDRRCEGCGDPVMPQTRYRLDPAGYRARGVRLLAAKGRCHPCYNRQRRPADANIVEPKPKNPRRKAQPAQQRAENLAGGPAATRDELGRWALALVQANRELAELTRQRELNAAAEVAANVAEVVEARDAARAECGRLAGLLEEAAARIDDLQQEMS